MVPAPSKTKGIIKMSNFKRVQGVVKFFNTTKGFGFIEREDGSQDVFVHANALKRSGIADPLKQGNRVEFDLIPVDGRGPKAGSIKVLSA